MSTHKSYKEKAIHRERVVVLLCLFAATVMIIALVFFGVLSKDGDDGSEYVPPLAALSEEPSDVSADISADVEPQVSETSAQVEFETVKTHNSLIAEGDLILVNNEHKCSFPDETELVRVSSGKTKSYKLGMGDELLLQTTLTALNEMLDGFYEATQRSDVTLLAAYYTYEKQSALYESALKKYSDEDAAVWAVLPGASEHHTGLAVNLTVYPSNGNSIGNGEYAWITSNAHKYGFVLRYPIEKQNITFVKDDKDHFRYVGKAHATYMYENGLCLEEYLSLLRLNSSVDDMLSVTAEDGTYLIYYVQGSDGEYTDIQVPKDAEYQISGNNNDGFVVTVKTYN